MVMGVPLSTSPPTRESDRLGGDVYLSIPMPEHPRDLARDSDSTCRHTACGVSRRGPVVRVESVLERSGEYWKPMPPRATPEGVTSSIARSARDELQDTCGALIERIADRDETGLAALYDQTSALVFGLTVKILQDRRDAEESTLEVYQQVWRQADRYDPRRGTPLG